MAGILPQKTTLDQVTWCLISMVSVLSKRLSGEGRWLMHVARLAVQLLEDRYFFLYSECVLPTYQDSLADCLLALFCPRGNYCTIMKRFWDHLSSCLHSLLFRGTYPLLNYKMQVICLCKYLFSQASVLLSRSVLASSLCVVWLLVQI